MLPSTMLLTQLKAEQFRSYPPQARQIAANRMALLQQLPVSFTPLLLRELIEYDWKFPMERKELDQQLTYLSSLPSKQLEQAMESFAKLDLSTELTQSDWVSAPGLFSEKLTAHLWATHQIGAFREAAVKYMQQVNDSAPTNPLPVPRLAIVIIGHGVTENQYRLFRKLRSHGAYFKQVKPDNGCAILLQAVAARAREHPIPYAHWYIDGAVQESISCDALSYVSYNKLQPVRNIMLRKMRTAYESGTGSEALRTMFAQIRPEELGLDSKEDPVFNRFQVSLLTEGSGTQIFSTTFVQWAAREALRRAQPMTLLARYTPRVRERPMNQLITRSQPKQEFDPQGSLIDADMGAYYTWLNQQRLPGAEESSFLVWFENHQEAVAIAPSLPRGGVSDKPIDMEQLVERIT